MTCLCCVSKSLRTTIWSFILEYDVSRVRMVDMGTCTGVKVPALAGRCFVMVAAVKGKTMQRDAKT